MYSNVVVRAGIIDFAVRAGTLDFYYSYVVVEAGTVDFYFSYLVVVRAGSLDYNIS